MYPLYLKGPRQHLLLVIHLPDANRASGKWVLHLPAFCEEMNKSRAMVSSQARAFAGRGYAVVVPDLRGTGDSEGDFADASWTGWKEDVSFLLEWMREQGAEHICLWGLRLGALLAVDVASDTAPGIDEMLLWQPVFSGKQAMTQFLRLRMAVSMMQGQQESVAQLRHRLTAGEALEIAGYVLSPQMLVELDEVEAAAIQLQHPTTITLLEVAGDPQKPLTPVTRKQVDAWRAAGIHVEAAVVCGEPFWSTQEIASAPAVIEASAEVLDAIERRDVPTPRVFEATDWSGERAFVFDCRGEELLGVLHTGEAGASRGILLVVGGPQYRVGSHRQFTGLARDLAAQGVPVFRFDYRGMGDSSGDPVDFLGAGDDIRAAVDAFQRESPGLEQVIIWGLCDAATAASCYAPGDSRVVGLVLLNPWVRSEAGEAKAYIKHYYLQRLFSRGLWAKILGGDFNFGASFSSLLDKFRNVSGGSSSQLKASESTPLSLAERMERDLGRFKGRVLFILSGNDLTAAEFSDSVSASRSFTRLLEQQRFSVHRYPEADHTFSRNDWKSQVAGWTRTWMSDF
jgi:exosortase A-associated hydrolase 1/exosortase A-associated hydrolase 2